MKSRMATVLPTPGGRLEALLATRRAPAAPPSRSSEELALEACALGVWRLDFTTGRYDVNARFKQVLGHEVGLASWDEPWDDLNDILHPEDEARVYASLEEHLDGLWPFDVTCRVLTRHGDYREMRLTGQAEWADSGEPLQVAGTIEDVSEQARVQRELVASEARFRALFQQAPYGLLIEEADGTRFENPALQRLGVDTPGRGAAQAPYGPMELVARRASSGDLVPVRVRGMPLGGGRMIHLVEDIRGEVAARQREEALQRELVEASRLAGMADMATGVLHNLGNVLNSAFVSSTMAGEVAAELVTWRLARVVEHLGAAADVLDDTTKRSQFVALLGATSAKLEGQRDGLVHEIQRVRSTLEHARAIVAAQQEMARHRMSLVEQVSLSELFQQAWATAAAVASLEGVDARTECLVEGEVEVDRHALLQILVNLLINAVQAVQGIRAARPRVTLLATPLADGRCRIAVRDNGVGMTAEVLEKLFVHGYTTKPSGRGFGLHHSATTAVDLGGRLWAESDGPGKGATMLLELPMRVPHRATDLTGRHQRVTAIREQGHSSA